MSKQIEYLMNKLEMRFPNLEINEKKYEKTLAYHSGGFGINALEYVVFIGSVITLGIFTAAFFQLIHKPSTFLFYTMAAILLGSSIILQLTIKKRLIDALGAGLALFGLLSFGLALSDTFKSEKELEVYLMLAIAALVLILRKNLVTILGVIAFFWILFIHWKAYQVENHGFYLVVLFMLLLLSALIYFEEQIMVHLPRLVYFAGYIKNGIFIALSSYFIIGYNQQVLVMVKQNNFEYWIMYGELLVLSFGLFIWQYSRLKAEAMPLWLLLLIPFSLFAIGVFNVNIVFFLFTFLAFLFTKSLFGSIVSGCGLIYSIIHFYYSLQWTLLQKSMAFIALGALLIGVYVVINHLQAKHEKDNA